MTSYIQLDAEANAIQVSLLRLLNGAFLDGYVSLAVLRPSGYKPFGPTAWKKSSQHHLRDMVSNDSVEHQILA